MPRLRKIVEEQVLLLAEDLPAYLKNKGVLKTAWRICMLPRRIMRIYFRSVAGTSRTARPDEFDLKHDVETSARVHTSDLLIDSPNWIHAVPYIPTPSGLLTEVLRGFDINFQEFTFVDFGSGKGRVLLMASELPFRSIIGVEFSPELHEIAQRNIASYKSATQKCSDISLVCTDFINFELPSGPLFAFLYNPTSRAVTSHLASNIMTTFPRQVWILYVTPHDVFDSESALQKVRMGQVSGLPYCVYTNSAIGPAVPAHDAA
jgi:SAM-dependent methyltransferase